MKITSRKAKVAGRIREDSASQREKMREVMAINDALMQENIQLRAVLDRLLEIQRTNR